MKGARGTWGWGVAGWMGTAAGPAGGWARGESRKEVMIDGGQKLGDEVTLRSVACRVCDVTLVQ